MHRISLKLSITLALLGISAISHAAEHEISLTEYFNQNVGINPIGTSFDAADVNGDGYLDIAYSINYQGITYIGLSRPDGTYAIRQVAWFGSNTRFMDFDNDGDLDVVHNYFALNPHRILVHINQGNGNFSGTTSIATSETPFAIKTADMDGDGDTDIIYGSGRAGYKVYALENTGGGNYIEHTLVTDARFDHSNFQLADFDGDGDLDMSVAIGRWYTHVSTPMVWRNEGNWTMSPAYTEDTASQIYAHYYHSSGDVDGDGDIDIVMTGYEANSRVSNAYIFENDGTMSFTRKAIFSEENRYWEGNVLADFDGDGDLDFATTDGANRSSWINPPALFLNDGSGNFSFHWKAPDKDSVNYNTISWQTKMFAFDMEGDGDLELITGGYYRGYWYGFNEAPVSVDKDSDGDGLLDSEEEALGSDPNNPDSDGDGINDGDEVAQGLDPTSTDSDGDGVDDDVDLFPTDGNEAFDYDGDGVGDNADTDDDNDGVDDSQDAFPFDATESVDTDGDGVGNNADTDDDNDGVDDSNDAFPLDSTESSDFDGDGIGDNADTDDDNDGVDDSNDAFPFDASESADFDGDGVGDNADNDDDNDGITDDMDQYTGMVSGNVDLGTGDTGIADRVNSNGVPLSVLLSDGMNACSATAKNHGKYVSCMAKVLNALKKQGLITDEEKDLLQSMIASNKR